MKPFSGCRDGPASADGVGVCADRLFVDIVELHAVGDGCPRTLVSRPEATPDVLRGEKTARQRRVIRSPAGLSEQAIRRRSRRRAGLVGPRAHARSQSRPRFAAEKAYRRATEIDPRFAEAFNNLGVLVRERGALDESRTREFSSAPWRSIPSLTAARLQPGVWRTRTRGAASGTRSGSILPRSISFPVIRFRGSTWQ